MNDDHVGTWSAAFAAATAEAKPLVSLESTLGSALTVVTFAVDAFPSAAARVCTWAEQSTSHQWVGEHCMQGSSNRTQHRAFAERQIFLS